MAAALAFALVVGAGVAFLVLAGAGAEAGESSVAQAAGGLSYATSPAPDSSPGPVQSGLFAWPAELIWPSDRTFKADQLERLGYAPEVVFFGGSRSRRFEPSYLQELTGLKGFNLAMTNAKPEDAWAFAHFLHERSPDTKVRWVWGVHVSTLMDMELDSGLVQDPRLGRYLPADLLRERAALLPTSPDAVPDEGRAAHTRYAPDGVVVWDQYDRARARGYSLARALKEDVPRHLRRLRVTPLTVGRKPSRSADYLEATDAYLNAIGDEVVLVAMPLHPTLLAALRAEGWQGRHNGLLAYVAALRTRYDLEFIDLTELERFDGDPEDFYDAIHMGTANARRVIDKLANEYPEVFAK